MKALQSFETVGFTYPVTVLNIPEDLNLHQHHCQVHTSCIYQKVVLKEALFLKGFYSNILLLVLSSTVLTTCRFQCSLPHFQTVINDLHSLLNNILNFSHILLRCEYFLGTFFSVSLCSLFKVRGISQLHKIDVSFIVLSCFLLLWKVDVMVVFRYEY